MATKLMRQPTRIIKFETNFHYLLFYRLKFVSNRWVTKQTGILPYDKHRPRDELTQLVIGVRGKVIINMINRKGLI